MSIREQILSVISEVSGIETIDTHKSLVENGLDSLDITEVIMNIEDETGVTIPENDLQKLKTIDDMIYFVESKA